MVHHDFTSSHQSRLGGEAELIIRGLPIICFDKASELPLLVTVGDIAEVCTLGWDRVENKLLCKLTVLIHLSSCLLLCGSLRLRWMNLDHFYPNLILAYKFEVALIAMVAAHHAMSFWHIPLPQNFVVQHEMYNTRHEIPTWHMAPPVLWNL